MRTLFEICESILTSNGIGLPKHIHNVTKLKGRRDFFGVYVDDDDRKVETWSKNWIKVEFESSEGNDYVAYWAKDSKWILYYSAWSKEQFFKKGLNSRDRYRYWSAWAPDMKFELKDFARFDVLLSYNGANSIPEMVDIKTDLE